MKSFDMISAVIMAALLFTLLVIWGYKFAHLTGKERKEQVRQWLLAAVIWAETQYGSGTGSVKLSAVYRLFCQEMPWLAKVLSFSAFSALVDSALEEMRSMLEQNKAVAQLVSNPDMQEATV